MIDVINKIIPYNIDTPFMINNSIRLNILQNVYNEIDRWQGTKLKQPAQSKEHIMKKTRTWWNRVKSGKLAELLFYVILFENCFDVKYDYHAFL